jgi:hypothetical protein
MQGDLTDAGARSAGGVEWTRFATACKARTCRSSSLTVSWIVCSEGRGGGGGQRPSASRRRQLLARASNDTDLAQGRVGLELLVDGKKEIRERVHGGRCSPAMRRGGGGGRRRAGGVLDDSCRPRSSGRRACVCVLDEPLVAHIQQEADRAHVEATEKT